MRDIDREAASCSEQDGSTFGQAGPSTVRRRRQAGRRRVPTSRDVAERAGVSRTVVSFVLNDRPHTGIPEVTRQRVLRAASDLGYRPNSAARSLVSGRTRTLGVVVNETRTDAYGDAFLPELLRGIDRSAREVGFRIQLEYLADQRTHNPYLLPFHEGRVDGVLVCGPRSDDPSLTEVVDAGLPMMVIGDPGMVACPSVDVDNADAARAAVTHLIGHGYRRIGLITNLPLTFLSSRARMAGYRQALEDAGLAFSATWIVEGGLGDASGQRAMEQLLGQMPQPDAVFVASDQVALGALAALQVAGLRVPDDVALIGFDDLPVASLVRPSLSTIRVPAADLGRVASRRLLDLIEGQPLDGVRMLLPTALVLRHSCGTHQETAERGGVAEHQVD